MIDGILAVDKPAGWTSHDVVARVRSVAGQRQVGHAGTLDPLATGLLLVVLGRATRLAQYLTGSPKTYLAEVVLGATTATDDAEAPLLCRSDLAGLSVEVLGESLHGFVGDIQQVPPAYAAVKVQGERMYRLARRGEDIRASPRSVTVHDIAVQRWDPPRLRLRIRCGAGTYIRAIARDLGVAVGCGGYLHALRRVESGTFRVERAVRLPDLDRQSIVGAIVPLERAVLSWAAVVVNGEQVAHIADGRPVDLGASVTGNVRLYGPTGWLAALARCSGGCAQPFRVFTSRSECVSALN